MGEHDMKKLPTALKTPARVLIAVGLIVLVGEFLIMMLIESIHTATLKVGFLENVDWKFLDLIMLAAFELGLLVQCPENQEIEGGSNKRSEHDGIEELPIHIFQKTNFQGGGMNDTDQHHDQKLAHQDDQTHRNQYSRRGLQGCWQLFHIVLPHSKRSVAGGSTHKNDVGRI